MPEQPRNHAEEIAAALRARAAETCGPHARTLAGAASLLTTPRKPEAPPATKPDLAFAKSVLVMQFERLYKRLALLSGVGSPAIGLDPQEADEIRAAVDAIVYDAKRQALVSVNTCATASADLVAKRIDLTDLAAVMIPLVLPELDRIARAIADAPKPTICAAAGHGVTQTMKWIKHADIVGMVSISNCEFCGEHHPRRAVYSDGTRYYAFCPQNGGRQMDLKDYHPVLTEASTDSAIPVADAPKTQAVTPAAPDTADIVERRTIDRVMELRNALRDLLARDLAGMVANREHWHADYRAVVERAETVLGIVPAPAETPEPEPAPAMEWQQLAGYNKEAMITNCASCGLDHARVSATQYRTAPYEWHFHCPSSGRPVVLDDFPEIPF